MSNVAANVSPLSKMCYFVVICVDPKSVFFIWRKGGCFVWALLEQTHFALKGALCNFFYRPVNKQRDRAHDAMNSSLQELTYLLGVL